jgi:hypothetical protein
MATYVTVADVMAALGRSRSHAYAHLARARGGRQRITVEEWTAYAERTFGPPEGTGQHTERAAKEIIGGPPTARPRPNPLAAVSGYRLVPTVRPRQKPR